jgi:hypothetical protein
MDQLPPQSLTPAERTRIESDVREAIWDAQAGKDGALARLRQLGAEHPQIVIELTRADLANLAALALVNRHADRPQLAPLREGILLRFEQHAAELAGPNPSAARRLVAARAAYSETEAWILAMTAAGTSNPAMTARLDAADRRPMLAMKTLAQIQRLESRTPMSAVQINVHADRLARDADFLRLDDERPEVLAAGPAVIQDRRCMSHASDQESGENRPAIHAELDYAESS